MSLVIGRNHVSGSGVSAPSSGEAATRTLCALERLALVLARASGDLEALALRARHLREEIASGGPLAEIMRAEERPLLITRMTQIGDELTEAALAVRRAEAQQLRGEGASQQEIAAIFGVSRQRVGVLLAEPEGGVERRRPHRPGTRTAPEGRTST